MRSMSEISRISFDELLESSFPSSYFDASSHPTSQTNAQTHLSSQTQNDTFSRNGRSFHGYDIHFEHFPNEEQRVMDSFCYDFFVRGESPTNVRTRSTSSEIHNEISRNGNGVGGFDMHFEDNPIEILRSTDYSNALDVFHSMHANEIDSHQFQYPNIPVITFASERTPRGV